MTIDVETKTFSTIKGIQFLERSFFNTSVVIQYVAFVFFAKSLYFFEWKKEISLFSALYKSFIFLTFWSKLISCFFKFKIFNISEILKGPWFIKKGFSMIAFNRAV